MGRYTATRTYALCDTKRVIGRYGEIWGDVPPRGRTRCATCTASGALPRRGSSGGSSGRRPWVTGYCGRLREIAGDCGRLRSGRRPLGHGKDGSSPVRERATDEAGSKAVPDARGQLGKKLGHCGREGGREHTSARACRSRRSAPEAVKRVLVGGGDGG